MSARATAWAWRQRGLSLADRAVLLALADRADHLNSAFVRPILFACSLETPLSGLRQSFHRLQASGLIVHRGFEIVLLLDRPDPPPSSADIVRLREVDGSAVGLARLEREVDV